MIDTPVHELDMRIQQLSLSDQLWLVEKLAQHIRVKVNDVVGQDEPLAEQESAIFDLNPDSPLYEDMQQILEDKKRGRLKFYSHREVFGESTTRKFAKVKGVGEGIDGKTQPFHTAAHAENTRKFYWPFRG
jgi:hypothetical protein